MHPSASRFVTIAIAALAILVAIVAAAGYGLAGRKLGEPPHEQRRRLVTAVAAVDGWLVLTAVLALTGVLAQFEVRPPPLMLVMAATLVLAVVVAFSPVGARLATLPLGLLVGFHVFRLPLEIVMHAAANEGTMPPQMSYGGDNFDIATGITAAIVAPLAARGAPRSVVLAWNILGSLLLLNIIVIAVRSTPFIAAYGEAAVNLNTWVAYFPFVWMTVLVGAALVGHLVIFRKIRGQ